MEMEIQLV